MSKLHNALKQDSPATMIRDEMPLDELSQLADKLSQQLSRLAAGDHDLQISSIGKMLSTAQKMFHAAGKLFSTIETHLGKESRNLHDASQDSALRSIILQMLVTRRETGDEEPIGVKELQQQLLQDGITVKLFELRAALNGLIRTSPSMGKIGCTSNGQYFLILPNTL
jgi:hypothetical protein